MAKKIDIQGFFSYMGNKSDIADWIIPMFPPHRIYVEVFGGTGAILLNKQKSEFDCYNDLNSYLSNLFEVVRVEETKNEFLKVLQSHNISQVTYERFYLNHEVKDIPDIESAVRYYYIMSLCALGKYDGGFQPSFQDPEVHNMFFRDASKIEKIHKKIKDIIVFNRPYDKIIKKFQDTSDALIYLDPPYKNTEDYYKTIVGDFTVEDHVKLRDMLSTIKGKFMVSYEDHEFIRDLYRNFNIYTKEKFRPGKKDNAVEILITNFKQENTLFDLST